MGQAKVNPTQALSMTDLVKTQRFMTKMLDMFLLTSYSLAFATATVPLIAVVN